MFQVRCPSCRRLLDVPEGSERATSVCPACRAAFVPEQAVAASPGIAPSAAELATGIQERPNRKLGRKTQRRNGPRSAQEPPSSAWRLAKIVFWLALSARAALALAQHRTQDELFLDLLFAPLFAMFVAAIVVVIKGTFFGWSRDGRPAEFGWLLWPFVAGSLMTAS
jgi:LSD1 subclass zinc finger protein